MSRNVSLAGTSPIQLVPVFTHHQLPLAIWDDGREMWGNAHSLFWHDDPGFSVPWNFARLAEEDLAFRLYQGSTKCS